MSTDFLAPGNSFWIWRRYADAVEYVVPGKRERWIVKVRSRSEASAA